MNQKVKILPHLLCMTDSSQFKLPLSPYLDNSTTWWIHKNLKVKYSMLDLSQRQQVYNRYCQWMRDQGVIVREIDKPISDDTDILFIDDQSMLVFSLRWGN